MSDTRDRLQDIASTVTSMLPPHSGFILLAFDFKPGGRIEYVSNGQRQDCIAAMREFIAKSAGAFGTHQPDKQFPTGDKITLEEFEKHRLLEHSFTVDDGQRQMILCALALCALQRPGWDYALTEIALRMDNVRLDGKAETYERLKEANTPPDNIRTLLKAASSALRSYQHGNAATDLARDLADKIDQAL